MLVIHVEGGEKYDEERNEFIYSDGQTIQLEHSLVSVSKWEAKWKKPFLSKEDKTNEETIDYIKCMTLTQNVKPEVYEMLSNENLKEILDYIADPMTATTFSANLEQGPRNREIVTSELIYYWMVAYQIPSEFQKWHLNRLLTLIKVCSIKNQPPKKMGKKQLMARNKALNDARRAKLGSSG